MGCLFPVNIAPLWITYMHSLWVFLTLKRAEHEVPVVCWERCLSLIIKMMFSKIVFGEVAYLMTIASK